MSKEIANGNGKGLSLTLLTLVASSHNVAELELPLSSLLSQVSFSTVSKADCSLSLPLAMLIVSGCSQIGRGSVRNVSKGQDAAQLSRVNFPYMRV